VRKFISEHPILFTCLTSCTTFIIGTVLLFSFLFFLFLTGAAAITSGFDNLETTQTASYKFIDGNPQADNKILVIPIKGVILTYPLEEDSLFSFLFEGQVYGYSIKKELVEAANDPDIKGVILEIDSPGGTIAGAKAITDGVDYFKKATDKPILSHILGMGASGGYWAAASADEIIADTGSLTGSIGVIMGPFKYYNKVLSESDFLGSVTTEEGIESFNIYAGEDKDLGDPYKKLSEKAKKTLQESVDKEYEIFVDFVSQKRNVSTDTLKKDVGALIFGNEQALNHKLIDEVGSSNYAYSKMAKSAGLSDYQVVERKSTRGFLQEILSVFSKSGNMTTSSSIEYHMKSVYTKANCLLCNKMLFLYGNPEEYL